MKTQNLEDLKNLTNTTKKPGYYKKFLSKKKKKERCYKINDIIYSHIYALYFILKITFPCSFRIFYKKILKN